MAWLRWSSGLVIVLAQAAMLLSAPASAQRGVELVGTGQATPYIHGTYRALVIGNDRYKDPEGLWKPLKTAVKDARAVADVLKNQYGFGDVRLLLDATRRQMNTAFNQIAEDSRNNDSVLIYYAGHGLLRESTGEGYWIPVDAEGRDDGTFYPNSIIKTKVGVIANKAKHVLLVSDSCFSGALLREGNRGISIDQRNEGYFRKVAAKKSVQILAAGGLEFVDDNFRGTGHSPFTYFFLEELKTNAVWLLDATELSSAVVRNVANNVRQSPEKGVLHGAGHEGGEFFFAKSSVGTTSPVTARTIDAEEEFWRDVKDTKVVADLEDYLKEFPSGRFTRLARVKIRRLKRKTAPTPKPVAAIRTKPSSNTWRDSVTGMEFVKVSGGLFEMGCHANAGKCDDDEKPVRTVRLDGFWLGKHEVTQGQWKKVMGNNPSRFKKSDKYPMETVNWDDVQLFIRKLNAESWAGFRLPSEAEWEYACRAGGKLRKFGTRSGDISSAESNNSNNKGATTAVGNYRANTLGLHDMSGNVWEWVQDKFSGYGKVTTNNPIFEDSGASRVARGGSWINGPRYLRCSNRNRLRPSYKSRDLGFRIVRK